MFGLGCAMTMLRTIIPLLGNPAKAIKAITAKHFTLGLFLGGYIGIYRVYVLNLYILYDYLFTERRYHMLSLVFSWWFVFYVDVIKKIQLVTQYRLVSWPDLLFGLIPIFLYHLRLSLTFYM